MEASKFTIPKTVGFLPLVPIFSGLSALDSLGRGAAGIAKAVKMRDNQMMESIAN